ncbi:unnamed protein product [Closterium sp. NIES-65]|nr:unnamed protein product [Closterium sp. NIES-65]
MAPLILTWYSERSPSASPYRPYHSPAPSHSSRLLLLPFLTVARPFSPKARSAIPPLSPSRRARIALPQPRALSTVQQRARLPFLVAHPALPQSAPSPSSSSPLSHWFPLHYLTPPPPLSSLHLLQLVADCVVGAAAAFFAAIPPPLVSPLIGSAADYFAIFPPLVSPRIGSAADYFAIFPPPLVSPLIGSAADYFAIFPHPLVSPRIGSAADYFATFPPPLVSPLSGSAADYPALIPPPLKSLPTSALQLAVNFPSWLNCLERTLSGTLVSGLNLWFVTQQSGSSAIPTSPSAPTSSSSYLYADGLRAAIAETVRLVATAQATAMAAPDNAGAYHLARILVESLESTCKRLTGHLAAPSPRSTSTPLSCAPSHSELLADWHYSHIRYAKDLLGYLTERFQSQTPISVIALLRELTSLRLADFTTMADYIAQVQTLSSQLAAQQFELSDQVCGALLLTGLTPEYSVHVTLYGERPDDQWSFSRVSAFLLQAELNLRSCPPTAAAVTPSSAPPPLSTTTAAAASSRPRNTFPPCTYIIRQYLRPTAAALSLPRTLEFVLDSGATDSVFCDAGVIRSFPCPLSIQGAGDTMTMTCTAISSLPCLASPSGAVTGLYVTSCRHNLLSLSLCSSTSLCASYLS